MFLFTLDSHEIKFWTKCFSTVLFCLNVSDSPGRWWPRFKKKRMPRIEPRSSCLHLLKRKTWVAKPHSFCHKDPATSIFQGEHYANESKSVLHLELWIQGWTLQVATTTTVIHGYMVIDPHCLTFWGSFPGLHPPDLHVAPLHIAGNPVRTRFGWG